MITAKTLKLSVKSLREFAKKRLPDQTLIELDEKDECPLDIVHDLCSPDKVGITLHHLLTHSAGLQSDFADDFDPISRDEIIKRALASKLRSPPGQRYHYSNAGFSLLAAIIELVSGQSYEAYLNENLFKPAGMIKTGYRLPAWKADEIAQGYLRGRRWGTIFERRWAADGPYWNMRGNGGIHTTAADMLKWHLALGGDAVLSDAARAKLSTPHMREGQMSTYYGYGWVVGKTQRGTRLIEHNGGNGIFTADCKRYVDDGVFVFAASNNSESPAWIVTSWLDALIFGGDYPKLPDVAAVQQNILPKLAGTYQLPGGGKLIAAVEKDQLVVGAEGQDALTLLGSGKISTDERLSAASTRTAAIFEANAKGDYAPLQRALGGRSSLKQVTANQTGLRQQLESQHGPYQGFEVLGSARAGKIIDTYVRLKFAKGSVIFRYGWDGTELVLLGRAESLPGALRFRPLSATDFASFNFKTGRIIQISFAAGADDSLSGLTLQAGESKLVAKKVQT